MSNNHQIILKSALISIGTNLMPKKGEKDVPENVLFFRHHFLLGEKSLTIKSKTKASEIIKFI